MARGLEPLSGPTPVSEGERHPRGAILRAHGFAAGLGWFTLGVQILVARELLATFSGTELFLAIFYSGWLAAFGTGAWIARRRGGSGALVTATVGVLVVPPWCLCALRHAPLVLGLAPGEAPPWWSTLLAVGVIVFPTGVGAGMLFPLAARFLGDQSRLGRFYAAEAAGGLLAGIATSVWLHRVDSFVALVPLSAGFVLSVMTLVRGIRWRHPVGVRIVFIAALLHALLWSGQGRRLIQVWWNAAVGQGDLVLSADSHYGRLTAAQSGDRYSFYFDGGLLFSCPPDPLEHLEAETMLLLPPAVRAVGIVEHPSSPIGSVCPDSVEVRAVHPDRLLGAIASRLCGTDPGIAAEPRQWLRESPKRFDLLVVYAPEPVTVVANRYYTREFFQAAARSLTPRGVMALSAHLPAAFLEGTQAQTASGTFHDLCSVFASVVVSPGPGGWFLASNDSTFTVASIHRRVASRDDDGLSAAYVDLLLPPQESTEIRRALWETAPLTPNTDRHPRAYFRQLQVWLERSGMRRVDLMSLTGRAYLVWLVVLGITALWLMRSRRAARFRVTGTVATTGFVSFAGSMLILLGFQHAVGTLYNRIAIVNGLYMAGLALGAWGGARRAYPLWRWDIVMAVLLALGAGTIPIVRMPAVYYFLTVALASAAGAQFASAARVVQVGGSVQHAAGLLEGYDHAGACLGGIAGGLVILPILGFSGAFVMLAAVKLMSASAPAIERTAGSFSSS